MMFSKHLLLYLTLILFWMKKSFQFPAPKGCQIGCSKCMGIWKPFNLFKVSVKLANVNTLQTSVIFGNLSTMADKSTMYTLNMCMGNTLLRSKLDISLETTDERNKREYDSQFHDMVIITSSTCCDDIEKGYKQSNGVIIKYGIGNGEEKSFILTDKLIRNSSWHDNVISKVMNFNKKKVCVLLLPKDSDDLKEFSERKTPFLKNNHPRLYHKLFNSDDFTECLVIFPVYVRGCGSQVFGSKFYSQLLLNQSSAQAHRSAALSDYLVGGKYEGCDAFMEYLLISSYDYLVSTKRSGGPLFCSERNQSSDETDYLAGIVSDPMANITQRKEFLTLMWLGINYVGYPTPTNSKSTTSTTTTSTTSTSSSTTTTSTTSTTTPTTTTTNTFTPTTSSTTPTTSTTTPTTSTTIPTTSTTTPTTSTTSATTSTTTSTISTTTPTTSTTTLTTSTSTSTPSTSTTTPTTSTTTPMSSTTMSTTTATRKARDTLTETMTETNTSIITDSVITTTATMSTINTTTSPTAPTTSTTRYTTSTSLLLNTSNISTTEVTTVLTQSINSLMTETTMPENITRQKNATRDPNDWLINECFTWGLEIMAMGTVVILTTALITSIINKWIQTFIKKTS